MVPLQIVKEGKQVLELVPVTIDGKFFTFALDTGASRSMIDSQVARKLAVPKAGSAGKVAGVNAVTPVSRACSARTCSAGSTS